MTQIFPIYHSDVVVTADNYQLGQAVKLYHRQTGINPAQKHFPHYLVVANLAIGDEFYVPTHYITAHNNNAGMHTLSLTLADIKKEQFTNLPRFIAMGKASEEDLPQPPTELPKPQTKELKTAPLPPNW